MHTILRVTMTDMSMANSAIEDGRLQRIFQKISKTFSPEGTFFYSEQGYRAALMIFDLKDSSLIPQLAEPFFNELNAKVEIFPAMNENELNKGLEIWSKESVSYNSLS